MFNNRGGRKRVINLFNINYYCHNFNFWGMRISGTDHAVNTHVKQVCWLPQRT